VDRNRLKSDVGDISGYNSTLTGASGLSGGARLPMFEVSGRAKLPFLGVDVSTMLPIFGVDGLSLDSHFKVAYAWTGFSGATDGLWVGN
jgi:hypothetical protein